MSRYPLPGNTFPSINMHREKCDRCHLPFPENEMGLRTMSLSLFNMDVICDPCKQKEITHPEFDKAREAVRAEEKAGNRDFIGIGLPKDLQVEAIFREATTRFGTTLEKLGNE